MEHRVWVEYRHRMGNVEAATLRINSGSGSVRIVAEDRDDIEVRGAEVEHHVSASADVWTISKTRGRVTAHVPTDTNLLIGTTSGSTRVAGRTGRTVVMTTSGQVHVENAAEVDIRVKSGRVRVDHCDGDCCIRCESGSVKVGSAGACDVHAKSGRVSVENANGDTSIKALSGAISIGLSGPHNADIEAISGQVSVTVPEGVCLDVDAETGSGNLVNSVPEGTDATVKIRATSGRIKISSSGQQ